MTENQMAAYITELQRSGLEAKSARAAGVTLRTVLKHYDADPGFKELCMDALEEFNDRLEEEAIRRAVNGVEKPVFQRGECVGHITEYSDTLMAKLLTGRRPNVYGNKTEVTGANGGPLTIQIEHFDEYSDIL